MNEWMGQGNGSVSFASESFVAFVKWGLMKYEFLQNTELKYRYKGWSSPLQTLKHILHQKDPKRSKIIVLFKYT